MTAAPGAPTDELPREPRDDAGPRPSVALRWLGAAGGLGLLPGAPGTWGSLGTAAALAALFGVQGWWSGPVAADPPGLGLLVLALGVVSALGVRLGDRAVTDWGRDDPGGFVLDEVVGQVLALLPALLAGLDPVGLLAGFVAFRVFDVLKPPPCRRLEALHGGLGIMADDVMAGLYGALVVLAVTASG